MQTRVKVFLLLYHINMMKTAKNDSIYLLALRYFVNIKKLDTAWYTAKL